MAKDKLVRFYTRNGCPLCEKAKVLVLELKDEYGFEYEERDIELKDEWTERYGLMIPVVEIDGVEVQYGIVDKLAIIEALTQKS